MGLKVSPRGHPLFFHDGVVRGRRLLPPEGGGQGAVPCPGGIHRKLQHPEMLWNSLISADTGKKGIIMQVNAANLFLLDRANQSKTNGIFTGYARANNQRLIRVVPGAAGI